jgi:hypothetical protein
MRQPERTCIAAKARQTSHQLRIGCPGQQRRQQRIFLGARRIHLVK